MKMAAEMYPRCDIPRKIWSQTGVLDKETLLWVSSALPGSGLLNVVLGSLIIHVIIKLRNCTGGSTKGIEPVASLILI